MFHMRNIVGPRVRKARAQSVPRLTQARLAARLQVDGWNIERSGIGKIEAGLREVTDFELLRLARALNVSVSWLLGENTD